MKLKIVGLGGIGSHLLLPLMQYVNFEQNAFDEVWFIDGDTYEEKNIRRQHVTQNMANKAIAQTEYYREIFVDTTIMFVDSYITKDNISKVITEGDVVLLCVDNNKTRNLFEKHIDTLKKITVISGGNELYDGNVMITHKVNDVLLSRKFSELHAELAVPTDKSPHEMSCTELQTSAPQIGIVNATVADLMRRTLYAMVSGKGITYDEIFVNCLTGMDRVVINPKTTKRMVVNDATNN